MMHGTLSITIVIGIFLCFSLFDSAGSLLIVNEASVICFLSKDLSYTSVAAKADPKISLKLPNSMRFYNCVKVK